MRATSRALVLLLAASGGAAGVQVGCAASRAAPRPVGGSERRPQAGRDEGHCQRPDGAQWRGDPTTAPSSSATTCRRRRTSQEPFADGFLPGVQAGNPNGRGTGALVMARPVDVLLLGGGSILIGDDTGNRVFRVTYQR